MKPPAFSLLRDNEGLTRIAFAGHLTEPDVLGFETDLRVQLSAAPEQGLRVIVDLTHIVDFSHECRDLLVRIHQFVATRARHTVLVADQPATRGLALWMIHMSGDRSARVIGTMNEALIAAHDGSAASIPPPLQSHIRDLAPTETTHVRTGS